MEDINYSFNQPFVEKQSEWIKKMKGNDELKMASWQFLDCFFSMMGVAPMEQASLAGLCIRYSLSCV